jgi:hypothetical protein
MIRTGIDGRPRYSREQRQDLLEAFDRRGLSAMSFSRQHGVLYQTSPTGRPPPQHPRTPPWPARSEPENIVSNISTCVCYLCPGCQNSPTPIR